MPDFRQKEAATRPDVPLVEGDVDRMRDPLGVADSLDERRADPDRALRLVRLEVWLGTHTSNRPPEREGTMTAHPLRDFQPIPTRPGQHARDLIATEYGVTSFFVVELRMEEGASVPLHTHPIEEAWVVTDGTLTVRIGDETVVAPTESVVRIPPGVPHAVRNDGRAEARALAGAPWNRATFFTEATTYLEGAPRE